MLIKTNKLKLSGARCAVIDQFSDNRGSFKKLYHASNYAFALPGFEVEEAYLTTSQSNVLRGMHFQLPPHDHAKIVVCLSGKVLEVMLDLRKGPKYGRVDSLQHKPTGINAVFLPKIVHGFLAHEKSNLLYLVSSEHSVDHDVGIRWNSFGFNWPHENLTLSVRDAKHDNFSNFISPF